MDALDKEVKIKPKFPLGFLILYFVLCASGITLLELLGRFIISKGAKGFLNALAGTAVMVVAFIVLGFVLLWFAHCLITPSNKLNKNKNFRCRGLFIMMKIISILSPITLLIIYIIIRIKALIIWCIKCYQRFAPDKVRNKCRFEPSCSNYMLIAIDKYGLIKGIKKGKDRLKRCCPPNGGYDEP